jgi:hypothetical protein
MCATGCRTAQVLADHTVGVTTTLDQLTYAQVLNNVAAFVGNLDALPEFAVVNAGTVTVADQKTVATAFNYAPTLTFQQQGGGALPILQLTGGPTCQRTLSENWSMVPVTDADNLRRMRCAFQILVGGPEANPCEDCRRMLEDFFLGEAQNFDCFVPRGWFHVGRRGDVPKGVCYAGSHCGVSVWVTPEGLDGLTRFTLTILELATGKPHAPMRTVVRTYKADGTLDTTQVTTSEIDRQALKKWRRETRNLPPRPRVRRDLSQENRGLFFVPPR